MADSDVIAARRNAFTDAFASPDIDTLSDFVTADHVGMPPNRPPLIGLEATQEFWREGFAQATSVLKTTPLSLDVAGDIAIDRFSWTMDVTPHSGGPTAHDHGQCVWIWRRESDGEWRVAQAIWNSDLAAPGMWAGA